VCVCVCVCVCVFCAVHISRLTLCEYQCVDTAKYRSHSTTGSTWPPRICIIHNSPATPGPKFSRGFCLSVRVVQSVLLVLSAHVRCQIPMQKYIFFCRLFSNFCSFFNFPALRKELNLVARLGPIRRRYLKGK